MTTLTITQFMQQEQEHTSGQARDYISASRLSLWAKCPHAFAKRYIEGILSPPSPAQFVGRVVHNVIGYAYRLRSVGEICPVECLPQFIADAWKLAAEMEPCYFDDDVQEEKSRYQVLDLVTAYLNATPIQNEVPVAVERKFEVPLITPSGEDLGIPLVGIVDLILREGNDNVIIDFKTSSTASISDLAHELQMTAYAYLVREVLGQQESYCEIRQLVKTKTPKIMTHRFPRRTDEHFNRFFGLIREYLEAIDRKVFNYRPSWTCNSMCEHYISCAC
jgi:hypothetical protein